MSDEDTSLAVHVGTVAGTTTAGARGTKDGHGPSKCNSIISNKKKKKKRREAAVDGASTSITIDPTAQPNEKITIVTTTATAAATAANNDYGNESEQVAVDLTLTVPITTMAVTTAAVTTTTRPTAMASIVRRPNASPTVILTMPSIAVTSDAADSGGATTVDAPATKRTCKRTGKIDFVRFDSVETIYKQTDHDEIIQRATIKDEIKK